jgi:hypothetical protein
MVSAVPHAGFAACSPELVEGQATTRIVAVTDRN